jgi:hypothetical protein
LEALMKESLESYKSSEELWTVKEEHYQAEIRRLELLIAHGTTGLAGVMVARKESVVKRTRPKRKVPSTAQSIEMYEYLSPEKLDEQIKTRSQRGMWYLYFCTDHASQANEAFAVHLHRPSSPSGKMTALSRHLSRNTFQPDIIIGTPPSHTSKTHVKLLRKMSSKLDLIDLGNSSLPLSIDSEFSVFGDPLPDEIEASKAALLGSEVECEAFVALRDLGTLVARRRDIDTDKFVEKLMLLFLTTNEEDSRRIDLELRGDEEETLIVASSSPDEEMSEWTPIHHLRRIQSQPHLSYDDQRRRRHFSFETGDDQVEALENSIDIYQSQETAQETVSPEFHHTFESQSEASLTRRQTLNAELQRYSKIPSPLRDHLFGRVRREISVSSIQSVSITPQSIDRRDSRSSIVTAIRGSSRRLRPQSASRGSSINNLRPADVRHVNELTGCLWIQSNDMALAAARAAENASAGLKNHTSPGNSKSRAARGSANVKSKNDAPEQRL